MPGPDTKAPLWTHDEYLAETSSASFETFARGLPPLVMRGETIIENGNVHWKAQPAIPCPRCEEVLQPGEVTLTFEHAPAESREQRVRGFVCKCGEYYVPGETAREAHHRAFAAWLAQPELRIPGLEERARELLGGPPSDEPDWEARFEASVLLHECIRLEMGRVHRAAPEAHDDVMAYQRICAWAYTARDPMTARRAWQQLTAAGAEAPAKLGSMVESLVGEFVAALRDVQIGRVVRGGQLEPVVELAHRFPGDARLWEQVADLKPPGLAQEDALIRAARLKGIVGIEDRRSSSTSDAVPPTLDGAVAVSPKAA